MKYSDHARCPGCSGNLVFNITEQMLECESCSSMYTVYEYNNILAEKKKKGAESFSRGALLNVEEEGDDSKENMLRSYTCSSCGGEITPGAAAATGVCPFCGNALVFTDKYRDQQVPDFIVPFKIDKAQFLEEYRAVLKKRMFVPDAFRVGATFKNIKAWYIPFWLFDVTVSGNASFQVERVSYSNKKYHHVVYSGHGFGSETFTKIPQDASIEVDDRISQMLEPFECTNAPRFSFAYLAGLHAKVYNVSREDCLVRAENRARESFDRTLSQAALYHYYKVTDRQYDYKPLKASYALFPIWHMDIIWQGRKFPCAVNGQTGKTACSIPVSMVKFVCSQLFPWLFCLSLCYWVCALGVIKDGNSMKGLTTLIFLYASVVYVCAKYIFVRNLSTALFSILFTYGAWHFGHEAYKVYSGGEKAFDIALVTAVILFVSIALCCLLWKLVKRQNALTLAPHCDYCHSDDYQNNVTRSWSREEKKKCNSSAKSIIEGSKRSKNDEDRVGIWYFFN